MKKIENEKCSENIDVKKNNQTLKTEKKQKKNNPGEKSVINLVFIIYIKLKILFKKKISN